MNEDKQDKPRSIFGDDDIRRSVETVDKRWRREMARRKRLALMIVLPLALILVGTWLYTAKKYQYFPFQKEFVLPPFLPPDEEEESSNEEKGPMEKMGNVEAKIKISVVLAATEENLPSKILDIFHEATDTKPSQLYVEIWEHKKAPLWLKDALDSNVKFAIGVNETPVFEPMEDESKVIKLINDYYSHIYKDDRLVIDPKTYGLKGFTEEELKKRSEKRLEKEREDNLSLPSLKFGDDKK